MSLFVVFVRKTGHVVGAVNAIGATPPADAAALVGAELPLRLSLGTGETVTVPLSSDDLEKHTPDDEPAVFTDPLAYGVEQVTGADPKPALVGLTPWTGGLSFGDETLVVMLPTPVSAPTEVVAFVTDGEDTLTASATIRTGKAVDLPISVASGTTHGVLVLVAGWVGRFEEVTAE